MKKHNEVLAILKDFGKKYPSYRIRKSPFPDSKDIAIEETGGYLIVMILPEELKSPFTESIANYLKRECDTWGNWIGQENPIGALLYSDFMSYIRDLKIKQVLD